MNTTMTPFNPVTHRLVVQAIDRAAVAIAYVAQPDSTVLQQRRREHSILEDKLRQAIPIALQACIDDIEIDVERHQDRRRPRRTQRRIGGNNADDLVNLLAAFGQLEIRPGDSYVIQRAEDA